VAATITAAIDKCGSRNGGHAVHDRDRGCPDPERTEIGKYNAVFRLHYNRKGVAITGPAFRRETRPCLRRIRNVMESRRIHGWSASLWRYSVTLPRLGSRVFLEYPDER
jgi:hypothetical protein